MNEKQLDILSESKMKRRKSNASNKEYNPFIPILVGDNDLARMTVKQKERGELKKMETYNPLFEAKPFDPVFSEAAQVQKTKPNQLDSKFNNARNHYTKKKFMMGELLEKERKDAIRANIENAKEKNQSVSIYQSIYGVFLNKEELNKELLVKKVKLVDSKNPVNGRSRAASVLAKLDKPSSTQVSSKMVSGLRDF